MGNLAGTDVAHASAAGAWPLGAPLSRQATFSSSEPPLSFLLDGAIMYSFSPAGDFSRWHSRRTRYDVMGGGPGRGMRREKKPSPPFPSLHHHHPSLGRWVFLETTDVFLARNRRIWDKMKPDASSGRRRKERGENRNREMHAHTHTCGPQLQFPKSVFVLGFCQT